MPIELSAWITPLLLLPGVGMLILSTSNRFTRLHDELHDLLEHAESDEVVPSQRTRDMFRSRAKYFHRAMEILYSAAGVLALAGLVGGSGNWLGVGAGVRTVAGFLTSAGVGLVLVASVLLVLETRLAIHVVDDHLDMLPPVEE